jgi:hypothetical protein
MAVGAINEDNILKGAVLQTRSERFAVSAKVVIDASGDGDMAFFSGANCHEFKDHNVGMAFGMSHVDFDKALAYGEEKQALVHKAFGRQGEMKDKLVKFAIRTARIPELKEKVVESGIHNSFTMTCSHTGEASYINGVNVSNGNVLDNRKMTETIFQLRNNVFKSVRFLQEYIPGFNDAYLNWTSQVVGPRHTRYVECEYNITAQDVNEGVVFEDSIGLFGAQDAHYKGYVIEGGRWYGIPYRALIPKFVENLLVSGRMISSDWVPWMSTRLTVSCFLQGQAAGTAAAISVRSGVLVREIDTEELRKVLCRDGVYLG